MAQFRFRVTSLADEPNLRGLPMVRVKATAWQGDAFVADDPLAEGVPPCEPDGSLSVLVSESFAKEKGLQRGAIVDLVIRRDE